MRPSVIKLMNASMIDANFVYIVHELQLFGFAATAPLVEAATLDDLIAELAPRQSKSTDRGGLRNLLDIPSVAALASAGPVRMIAEAALGSSCFAMRGIHVDPCDETNGPLRVLSASHPHGIPTRRCNPVIRTARARQW